MRYYDTEYKVLASLLSWKVRPNTSVLSHLYGMIKFGKSKLTFSCEILLR